MAPKKKSPTLPTRVRQLDKAMSLTAGDRNKQYGDPFTNHTEIADIYNAISPKGTAKISASDAARLHVATKLARLKTDGLHDDSTIDLMAYAGILSECLEAEHLAVVEALKGTS